jgi:hypothetical protein
MRSSACCPHRRRRPRRRMMARLTIATTTPARPSTRVHASHCTGAPAPGCPHTAARRKRRYPMAVSGAFPSLTRSILTEIYLCHSCSCHERLRMETPGQGEARTGCRLSPRSSLRRRRLPARLPPPPPRRRHRCRICDSSGACRSATRVHRVPRTTIAVRDYLTRRTATPPRLFRARLMGSVQRALLTDSMLVPWAPPVPLPGYLRHSLISPCAAWQL